VGTADLCPQHPQHDVVLGPKWRRVTEQTQMGANWITGCGNHDTLRRGTQVDPELDINWNLGESLPEVLNNAYDNPAIALLTYGFSPGLPMDFINCTMRAPWGFLRNTDDRYGVKVVAEEAGGFLDWQIIPETYDWPELFPRLKAMGFHQTWENCASSFGRFTTPLKKPTTTWRKWLNSARSSSSADPDSETVKEKAKGRKSAQELQKLNVPDKSEILTKLDVAKLKDFAKNFMEDAHEMCNVWLQQDVLDPEQVAFNLALRRFRQANPWLQQNLSNLDRFNRINTDDQTIFYGLRAAPERDGHPSSRQVAMVAHMGGDPLTVTLGDWLQVDLEEWRVVIASPQVNISTDSASLRAFELSDSQAVLLERTTP
jgi:hypothetical protein